MKTLTSSLIALALLAAAPALAEESGGHGGGCGGCGGGGHPGGGYDTHLNVNVNASSSAYATASAETHIQARAYDVASVGARGPVHGGVIWTGGGYGYGAVGGYGYGVGGHGPVVVTGPGYGPSRPHGYAVQGFGRHYVTTDRCGRGCAYPPPPPPPCHDPCRGAYPHGQAYGYGSSSYSSASEASYSVRESYSESASYSEAYREARAPDYPDARPRYTPIPYHAAPLEPVTDAPDHGRHAPPYAPPEVHYSEPVPEPQAYAPPEPPVHQPAPVQGPAPRGYYGDLPPGDAGEGLPYRQEPGERG